jgi:hypothetical protein
MHGLPNRFSGFIQQQNQPLLNPLTGTPLSTEFQDEIRRIAYQISGTPPAEYLSVRQAPRLAVSVP